jgi:hypothetical protein
LVRDGNWSLDVPAAVDKKEDEVSDTPSNKDDGQIELFA